MQARPDLQWDVKKQFPYQIGTGNQSGSYSKCHGCKRYLIDRNELRIQTEVKFIPPNSGPYPGKYFDHSRSNLFNLFIVGKANFCLNDTCVKFAFSLNPKVLKHCSYPPFAGHIGIPHHLKDSFRSFIEQNPNLLHGVQWQFI